MPNDADNDEAVKLLRALLAVLVDVRERTMASEPGGRKTEVVLESAGLGPSDIASLLGKNPATVRKTLSRARQSGSGAADE